MRANPTGRLGLSITCADSVKPRRYALKTVMNLLIMTVPLFDGNCAMAFNQDLSGRDTSKVKLILILSGTFSISSGALKTNEARLSVPEA